MHNSASKHTESPVIYGKMIKFTDYGFVALCTDTGPTDLYIGSLLFSFFSAYKPHANNCKKGTWRRVRLALVLPRLPLAMKRELQVFERLPTCKKKKLKKQQVENLNTTGPYLSIFLPPLKEAGSLL